MKRYLLYICIFFFQAEDGIRDLTVTGVQTCALPISGAIASRRARQDPVLRMSKRTIAVELATPGLDPQGRPARIPLAAGEGPLEQEGEADAGERMLIKNGPQHPGTHGVLCLAAELDGVTQGPG